MLIQNENQYQFGLQEEEKKTVINKPDVKCLQKCRKLGNCSGVLAARPSHSFSECWLETVNEMSGFKVFKKQQHRLIGLRDLHNK